MNDTNCTYRSLKRPTELKKKYIYIYTKKSTEKSVQIVVDVKTNVLHERQRKLPDG